MSKKLLPTRERVKKFLISSGLTPMQADAYIILAEKGPMLAYGIREKLVGPYGKKNTQRISEMLNKLVEQGYLEFLGKKITPKGECPLFDAIHLEDILKDEIQFISGKVYRSFDEVFDQRNQDGFHEHEGDCCIYYKEKTSIEKARERVAECKKTLRISSNTCRWLDSVSKKIIQSLHDRKVDVKFLISNKTPQAVMKWLEENKINYRIREELPRPYCIIDDKILLLGYNAKGKKHSYHLSKIGIIKQFSNKFDALWESNGGGE